MFSILGLAVNVHRPGIRAATDRQPSRSRLEIEQRQPGADQDPTNWGVKGAGGAGAVGAMPAVGNALADALAPLGIRDIAMPATPSGCGARSAALASDNFPAGRQKTAKERICGRFRLCQVIAFSAWFRANSLTAEQGNSSIRRSSPCSSAACRVLSLERRGACPRLTAFRSTSSAYPIPTDRTRHSGSGPARLYLPLTTNPSTISYTFTVCGLLVH
jgi:hypothetical protein